VFLFRASASTFGLTAPNKSVRSYSGAINSEKLLYGSCRAGEVDLGAGISYKSDVPERGMCSCFVGGK
jgi:hypothetical protein